MVSTISSAGWPVRSIAARISAMRLVAPVVDDGHVHGAQDALGDRTRARNLKEMASLMHENLPVGGFWPALRSILHSFFVHSTNFWYSIVEIDATKQANYCAANEIHDS